MADWVTVYILAAVVINTVCCSFLIHWSGGMVVFVSGFFMLILTWIRYYGWKLNFYFRSVALTSWFFRLFFFLLKSFINMNLHILAYCLKSVLGGCLYMLCWPFSMLACPAMSPFPAISHTALTLNTPAWLYPGGVWCSWQSHDDAPGNGQCYP